MSEVKRQFETITSNGVLWINIQKPTFADINALGQKYPFHRLNLEDCLSKIQIPKIDRYESHIFAILHFPTPDKEKGFLFSRNCDLYGLRLSRDNPPRRPEGTSRTVLHVQRG